MSGQDAFHQRTGHETGYTNLIFSLLKDSHPSGFVNLFPFYNFPKPASIFLLASPGTSQLSWPKRSPRSHRLVTAASGPPHLGLPSTGHEQASGCALDSKKPVYLGCVFLSFQCQA